MEREELIKSARKLYDSKWPNDALKKALEESYPELKESEDERIRKTLLRCCDDWDKGQFGCMKKEDIASIRAYLERQKERKPAEKSEKPIILEWREEDERIRKALVDLVYSDVNELIGGVEKRLCVAWLEKQKIPKCSPTPDLTTLLVPNRYNDQKPAEWSEEDEENLGKLHRLLVICQGEKKFIPASEYDKLDNWLKSLRPQHHWKPSEEQMNALKVSSEYGSCMKNREYLKSLYDDLKK